jgi:hypothetical protein
MGIGVLSLHEEMSFCEWSKETSLEKKSSFDFILAEIEKLCCWFLECFGKGFKLLGYLLFCFAFEK